MFKVYKAQIIKSSVDKNTMTFRVRIPKIHNGLKDNELPVAQPMITFGVDTDTNIWYNEVMQLSQVRVIFLDKKLDKLIYFITPHDI